VKQIEFSGKKIFFERGLPGFEDLKHFTISRPFEEYPFFYLQSNDEEVVAFLTINPFEITKEYEFEISDAVQETLEITDLADVAVINIVNASNGLNEATVNLQAPVIINIKNQKGMQVVLNNQSLNLKEPLKNMLQGTEG
jgi:flagellar assembly factor FliW